MTRGFRLISRLFVIPLTVCTIAALAPPVSAATQVTATLVQTIQTSSFDPPSPDPAGVTYNPATDRMLISDSEVDEMPIFENVSVFESTRTGTFVRGFRAPSAEPTGLALDPATNRLFLSDDNAKRVYIRRAGTDGTWGTSDDSLTSFSTSGFSNDPEDVAYDSHTGDVFITDGVGREVYRVARGGDGSFGTADDVVTHFDTGAHGAVDPEGLEYDPTRSSLLVLDYVTEKIYEVSKTGTLMTVIDVSGANATLAADVAIAPASNGSGARNLWIVARGVDNGADPNENDGRMYEMRVTMPSTNTPPTVTITQPPNGSTFAAGTPIQFTGSASDTQDGNLTSGLVWTSNLDGQIGTGGTFTTSTLSVGTHTITAAVTDTGGLTGSATRTVTVTGNTAPTVTISQPANGSTFLVGSPIQFTGSASDTQDGNLTSDLVWTSNLAGQIGTGGSFTSSSLGLGTHTITASVTDSKGLSGSATRTLTVTDTQTLDIPVATGSDDAEESAAGAVDLVSSDLELVQDRTTQTVGVRFAGVGVPPGVTILSAYVQFTADETDSEATSLLIQGQAAANPTTFTAGTSNVSARPRTDAQVAWSPAAWTKVNQRDVVQRTPQLAPVIQELIGQSGWAQGNAMALIFTGSGKRVADPFEGGLTRRPVLHIELRVGTPSNTPPSVSISAPAAGASFVEGTAIQFTGSATDAQQGDLTSSLAWSSSRDGAIGTGGSFTNSTLSVGTHTITASVTDSGGLTGSATRTITVTSGGGGGVQTLDIPIASGNDDAEEYSYGKMILDSSDLELVQEANTQTVGLRFAGVNVPVGATILTAYVQFVTDEVSTAATSLTIRCQAADNAPTFTTADRNISSRTLGSGSAAWSPAAWNTVGAAGVEQRTPDLDTVIQQVVSRSGWASGNAIVLVITGTGKRVAGAFEAGLTFRPVLHIEYQV